MEKQYPASALEFIARIKGDGSGLELITPDHQEFLLTNSLVGLFKLTSLSMTNNTFIASNMSTYIVRIKPVDPIQALKEEQKALVKRLEEIKILLQ